MRLKCLRLARSGVVLATTCFAILLIGPANAGSDRSIVTDGNAAKTLHETFSAVATAKIEISNVRGSVAVTGWDRRDVELGGSLGAGSKLEISADPQSLAFRVVAENANWFGGNGPRHDSNLILHVPQAAAIDLHVVSAEAQVHGVAGESLKVAGVSGKLNIDTAAPVIDVTSVSGDIDVSAAGQQGMMRVHVQSVSGDIRVKGVGGRVKLETISGNLDLTQARVQELETGSVSGDAKIFVALLQQARLHLESMSGDIHAKLPAALSANIDASTFSGGIASDYGTVANRHHGSGSSLKANLGSGDAQINVQTFSGDIELRKMATQPSK